MQDTDEYKRSHNVTDALLLVVFIGRNANTYAGNLPEALWVTYPNDLRFWELVAKLDLGDAQIPNSGLLGTEVYCEAERRITSFSKPQRDLRDQGFKDVEIDVYVRFLVRQRRLRQRGDKENVTILPKVGYITKICQVDENHLSTLGLSKDNPEHTELRQKLLSCLVVEWGGRGDECPTSCYFTKPVGDDIQFWKLIKKLHEVDLCSPKLVSEELSNDASSVRDYEDLIREHLKANYSEKQFTDDWIQTTAKQIEMSHRRSVSKKERSWGLLDFWEQSGEKWINSRIHAYLAESTAVPSVVGPTQHAGPPDSMSTRRLASTHPTLSALGGTSQPALAGAPVSTNLVLVMLLPVVIFLLYMVRKLKCISRVGRGSSTGRVRDYSLASDSDFEDLEDPRDA